MHDLELRLGRGIRSRSIATFADAVVEELEREPDAAVLFHDYHLYVAPALVRDRRPDAALAHFTHIPWVGADEWSVLPESIVRPIHQGLLACDVAGFHTHRWRRAFLDSCRSLGLDPDERHVTAHPISIDPAEFEGLARSEPVLARERELEAERPELLILRVDRTDPSKNVPRGLEAFRLLLERRPDLRGRVGMLALLDASRQDIPEYVEELRRIEEAAAAVETDFPGALTLRIADDFPASIAAYKQFDVLLVTAVMDGLNLVAKEAPFVNDARVVLLPYLSTQAPSRSCSTGLSRSLRSTSPQSRTPSSSRWRSARTSGTHGNRRSGARRRARSRGTGSRLSWPTSTTRDDAQ